MVDFAVSEVPLLWSVVVPWLRPPYLYLVLNCIIITIAASSVLQSRSDLEAASTGDARADHPAYESVASNEAKASHQFEPSFPPAPENTAVRQETDSDAFSPGKRNDGHDYVFRSPEPPRRNCFSERESVISTEKPLVSTRFGHRKAFNTSPYQGGRALRVSRPKRQDTLESTWKTITEGRPMPLTRHLKKSDLWESHARHGSPPPAAATSPSPPQSDKTRKSETLAERAAPPAHSPLTRSPGSGKLRKEPSLSQDELNRRVEAFIKKFNEEMRLQRQESLQQYQVMVGLRGVH